MVWREIHTAVTVFVRVRFPEPYDMARLGKSRLTEAWRGKGYTNSDNGIHRGSSPRVARPRQGELGLGMVGQGMALQGLQLKEKT